MFTRVFSVFVIPWDAIVVEKREQFIFVLKHPFLQRPHNLRIRSPGFDCAEEPTDLWLMSLQEPCLQPETVNRRNNSLQHLSEPLPESLQFLIERISQQAIVQIPHQMYKAFLLRAL